MSIGPADAAALAGRRDGNRAPLLDLQGRRGNASPFVHWHLHEVIGRALRVVGYRRRRAMGGTAPGVPAPDVEARPGQRSPRSFSFSCSFCFSSCFCFSAAPRFSPPAGWPAGFSLRGGVAPCVFCGFLGADAGTAGLGAGAGTFGLAAAFGAGGGALGLTAALGGGGGALGLTAGWAGFGARGSMRPRRSPGRSAGRSFGRSGGAAAPVLGAG